MVRGVSFELLVLPVNINGFYMLFFSNEKEKKATLTRGKGTNILWSLLWATHCKRDFLYILTFRKGNNNDRILLGLPPSTENFQSASKR